MKKYLVTIIVSGCLFLNACSGDGEEDKPEKGSGKVALFFDHGINEDPLVINGGSDFAYDSVEGEMLYNIQALDYVISNIVLIDESGKPNYPKDSLFIVSAENNEDKIVLKNIPSRKYTSITFGIGVPYTKWAEGLKAQEGFYDKALSAKYNIAWTWASGYKNLRFEGRVKEPESELDSRFEVHIGDHISNGKLTQDNYKKITCPFHNPEKVFLADNKIITIHFKVDAGKILNGKKKIRLSYYDFSIMHNEVDAKIADNFTEGMFTIDHIEKYDAHQ